ncbi:MAG TPA: hypothetical protein VFC14_05900 [Burkholderiales bacterium]|nr:hypothetical protein [Burkholderiales bacterium]
MRANRCFARSLIAGATLLLLPVLSFGAEPAGMVTDLQGVALRGGGGKLAILAELGAGAQLELEGSARVTVAHFASGRQFDLDGPGVFRLTAAGVESAGGGRVTARAPLAAAYRDVRLRPARVAQASISMRGNTGDAAVQLVSPVGTWLLERRPSFRWKTVAGVVSYRFELTDNTGRVLYETSTGEASVALPESVVLQSGQTYAWQVDARLPDGRVADGWTEFGIAGTDRRERVDSARPGKDASFGERVLFALLLDDAGLREAASTVWDGLARERPADLRLRTLGGSR